MDFYHRLQEFGNGENRQNILTCLEVRAPDHCTSTPLTKVDFKCVDGGGLPDIACCFFEFFSSQSPSSTSNRPVALSAGVGCTPVASSAFGDVIASCTSSLFIKGLLPLLVTAAVPVSLSLMNDEC